MSGAPAEIQLVRKVLSAGRILRGFRVDGPPPTWLLLPPVEQGAAAWLPVLRALGGVQAAIAVDFAGFGTSDIGKAAPSYLEQQAFLAAYLDTLHGPLVLVSCSTGTIMAPFLARREEHRIEAMLVSGFGAFEDGGDAWLARLSQAAAGDTEALEQATASRLSRPAYGSFFDRDARSALQSGFGDIPIPTLFVAGCDDRSVPPADAARAAERSSAAEIAWVAGGGHLVPTEQPQDFLRAAQAFLASVRGRQALSA